MLEQKLYTFYDLDKLMIKLKKSHIRKPFEDGTSTEEDFFNLQDYLSSGEYR
jgi:hypothetical protein